MSGLSVHLLGLSITLVDWPVMNPLARLTCFTITCYAVVIVMVVVLRLPCTA